MAGETQTGVTIMRVVKALDAGAMLATVDRPIGPDDTSEEVERDLAQLGAALLVQTLDRLAAGAVEEVPQDDSLATYAHRLTKDDGMVDWDRPASVIHNQIRGLHPWPHAYSYLDGQRLILLRSTWSAQKRLTPSRGRWSPRDGDELRVATGAARSLDHRIAGRRAPRGPDARVPRRPPPGAGRAFSARP